MRDKVLKALNGNKWRSYKDIMKIMSDNRYKAIARSVRQIKKKGCIDTRIKNNKKQFRLNR